MAELSGPAGSARTATVDVVASCGVLADAKVHAVDAITTLGARCTTHNSALHPSRAGVTKPSTGFAAVKARISRLSYHIISEIYSAPITKKTWTIDAIQKSARC